MEEKQENEKKGNLLIVDDDVSFLKLLEIQLKKHFNIVCARSGPEALEIIQKGFNPGVILSDLNMPIINGIEFLKETMKCVPHSIRIILSAFANPQEIISAINQSRAYMYLMKPIDQLQLIQVIKNAFETYNLIVKNNQLLETLKKIGITEAKEVEIITNSPQQQIAQKVGIEFVSALQKILSFSEKYYFTNHKSSVVAISKGLAEALKFSDRTTEEIVIAASLINITTLSMPKRFHLYDPYDLEQADRKFYFKLFSQTIESLEPVSAIRGSVTILSQIWENRIGSGGPKQVEGNKLLPEAQVISIANIYHNKVYRIQPLHLSKLEEDGMVIQTKEETFERHNEAIKFFYRKANWYENDIINTFQDMVKKRAIPEVTLPKTDLVLRNFDLRKYKSFITEPVLVEDKIEEKSEPASEEPQALEREVRFEKLKPGMIVAQNVVTKTGVLIVRQDNKLDNALVENIKYLAKVGLNPSVISFYVIPSPQVSE